jgi:hypothetical protein
MSAEAKVQAAEVGLKPPKRRRAEQPAKAGTDGEGGVSDEAMIQRPNVKWTATPAIPRSAHGVSVRKTGLKNQRSA